MTLIAAAIDVTTHTALNIDVGSSYEVISGIIIFCQFKLVHHNTSLTTAIDILIHIAALQLNVGAAGYHGILTITATVRITTHITTFHDVDIGLMVTWHRLFQSWQHIVGIGAVVFARRLIDVCASLVRQSDRIAGKVGTKRGQDAAICCHLCFSNGIC